MTTAQQRIADLATLAAEAATPAEALDSLGLIAFELDRLTRATVAAAREQGDSWATIGEALGTSRQAAWERYSASIDAGTTRTK